MSLPMPSVHSTIDSRTAAKKGDRRLPVPQRLPVTFRLTRFVLDEFRLSIALRLLLAHFHAVDILQPRIPQQ